jgi:YVTN family beta-propeller protein
MAKATAARRAGPLWRVVLAALISVVAGLGWVMPARQAADAALTGRLSRSQPGSASPVIVYVTDIDSGTVTPIAAATDTPGAPITAGSTPYAIAITPNGKTAYVTNVYADTVTPIQLATNTAGTPIPVGSVPNAIAITPDGKTAYVTDFGSDTVTPIAIATNTAGQPIVTGSNPLAIAITPNGKTAYVANQSSGTVTPIATATNTAGSPIPTGSGPCDIAITPVGETVYVANQNSGTVTPIATATNTAGPPITTGGYPDAIAITPDGETAYVSNVTSLSRLDISGTVTPIATATNTAGPPITVGSYPERIAITSDGKTAYVTNYASNTVTPIQTATNTAGPPITVGSDPITLAIAPDGRTVYVANGASGTVTPIATATNTAGPPITVGSDPFGIAFTPAAGAQGPAFTSGSTDTVAFGTAFTFTVTTTGTPAPRISRIGRLPAGVRFTVRRDGTATISGTPSGSASGVYPLTLTARNKNGTVTQKFSLIVTRTPAIGKIRTTRVRVGAALHLTIRATGYPAAALTESGQLPDGLFFADKGNGTAVITGIPAASSPGRYPIAITAKNSLGTAAQHFLIVVLPHGTTGARTGNLPGLILAAAPDLGTH